MKERIEKVIMEIANVGAADEGADLKLDLGLDSLSWVAVIVGLEEEFGIEFDEGDLSPENFATVGDLAALVGKYV